MLAAGLDGIERELEPPPAIARNIFRMTVREKRHHRVKELPTDLRELTGVARVLGYPPGAAGTLVDDYRRATRRARTVVEQVFYR